MPLLEEAAGSPVDAWSACREPLAAIQDAVNLQGFDELIISTLPDAGLEVAQARPALEGRGARAAGHDGDGEVAQAARREV